MHSTVGFLSLAAFAMAQPASLKPSAGYNACPASKGAQNPLCCSSSILKLASLDCFDPKQQIASAAGFRDICAGSGRHATCCELNVVGLGLLCLEPEGFEAGLVQVNDSIIPGISGILPGLENIVGTGTPAAEDIGDILPAIAVLFGQSPLPGLGGIVPGLSNAFLK